MSKTTRKLIEKPNFYTQISMNYCSYFCFKMRLTKELDLLKKTNSNVETCFNKKRKEFFCFPLNILLR